jgi:hypothetical protein
MAVAFWVHKTQCSVTEKIDWHYSLVYVLRLSRRQNCMNSSRADSRVNCLKTSDVSETHLVSILMEKWCDYFLGLKSSQRCGCSRVWYWVFG